MSAQEIIEQIKALPANDRAAVMDFVKTTVPNDASLGAPTARPSRDIKKLIHEVFDEHDELFRKLAQ